MSWPYKVTLASMSGGLTPFSPERVDGHVRSRQGRGRDTHRSVPDREDPMFMPWYYLIGILSWPVVHLLFRLRARGLENLPKGGFVLAGNHTSNFDPWAIGVPLVPAAIVGTDRLSRLGPLRVAYGAPIPLGDLDGRDVGTASELATERLMERIKEIEESLR